VEKEDQDRDKSSRSRDGLSKDHITSSFDKATALTDRDYFNSIMNDPHYHQHHHHPNADESPEEALNREKYEQAKNRFDELYRDIMNTEDLKNHPELIEELNKISPSDLQAYTSTEANPPLPPPQSQLLSEGPVPSKPCMVPPPSTQMNGHVDKEDYIHSLEDLDKIDLEMYVLTAFLLQIKSQNNADIKFTVKIETKKTDDLCPSDSRRLAYSRTEEGSLRTRETKIHSR